MTIRIITTGGTIDKRYNPLNGELMFDISRIEAMLEESGFTADYVIESLMLKDSLEMTQNDREKIVKACSASPEENIVITHGTDTMVESARAIAEVCENKTIVFTGAMVPDQFRGTDARFNLGCALTAVQLKESGVFIAMNGKVFSYDEVKKDKARGEFIHN